MINDSQINILSGQRSLPITKNSLYNPKAFLKVARLSNGTKRKLPCANRRAQAIPKYLLKQLNFEKYSKSILEQLELLKNVFKPHFSS